MSTPDPSHRTLNSCFGTFHSVRVHLGLFCYGSKLGAKWAELLLLTQKFMPWSHIRNIRNKWTNPPRWTKNSCFNAFLVFGCIWNHFLLLEIRREMGQTGAINAKVRATKVCATKLGPPCWTLNACFVAFNSVWVHLGMFCYDIKLGAKWAKLVQLMQQYVPQSHLGIFCNKRIRSSQLDPKLMFCCVS